MTALRSILCATDLSAPSRHAVDRAARLARETACSLTLLHVMPGSALDVLQRWLGREHASALKLQQEARGQLETLAAELAQQHGVHPQARLHVGPVADAVLEQAQSADLLVLGARGGNFLRRLALGTTSERLVRRARAPVLVVRQGVRSPYRRVMVAADFSAWTEPALAAARRVAPHAEYVLFTAFEIPFEEKLRFAGVEDSVIELYRRQARAQATQRLHALAAQAGLKPGHWRACIVEGDAPLRLLEQEQALDVDLVVLGKHGHSAAEDLLLGSVTQHMLAEGQTDVLVVPAALDDGTPQPGETP